MRSMIKEVKKQLPKDFSIVEDENKKYVSEMKNKS